MIIIIPEHVKERVDRIIAEYEKLLKQKVAIFQRVSANGTDYYGTDTTKYYVETLKKFREELDKQESPIFNGTPEEIQMKIYQYIMEHYDALSMSSIYEINRDVFTQKQLLKELRKAANNPETEKEARMMMQIIKTAKTSSWGQDDEFYDTKYFKLVRSLEEFESHISMAEHKNRGWELTPGSIEPFKQIRVAFEEVPFQTQYRKKGVYRTYKKNAKHSDFFDGKHHIFNFWNGISSTCIYYVYMP